MAVPDPRQRASREVRDRVARAARLRAEGRSWSKVAEELALSVRTVEGYPARYPKLWAAAERRAWERALAEATAEAVLTLRRLLRHDDDKVTREAATKLVQLAAKRLWPRTTGKSTAASAWDALEGVTDEELAEALAAAGRGGTPCEALPP